MRARALVAAVRKELARLPPKVPEATIAAGITLLVVWWLGGLVGLFGAGIAAGYVLGRKQADGRLANSRRPCPPTTDRR